MSEAPALAPQELEALLKQDPLRRAQWMLNDLAAHECAWGLEDGQGWVIAKLATPIPGGPAYALPLWPRQECAALEAAGPGEQPRSIDLETLMEELLPEIGERGWGVLAFCVKNAGQAYKADEFSNQLADAWEALTEDPD